MALSAKENTLFVFEGEKTEAVIVQRMEQYFMQKTAAIKCVFGGEIYQLYRILKEETFAVDIVSLLKERNATNRKQLEGYDSDSFAYVYFFFDYDAHATKASDRQLAEMLAFFDNETENGKLYVSYPMVEALRHFKDATSFKELVVKCKGHNCPHLQSCDRAEACLSEPGYKERVQKESAPQFARLDSYEIWKKLIYYHLSKANNLFTENFELPTCLIPQNKIFEKQRETYLSRPCPQVAVLSAFPLFLQDYYGVEKIHKLLKP